MTPSRYFKPNTDVPVVIGRVVRELLITTGVKNVCRKSSRRSDDRGVGYDKEEEKAFLGTVDKIGTAFEDDVLATGFGSYLCLPILREKWRADLEEGEARALLEDCLRVLFYRDCRALNRVQIAKATADGVLVSEPYEIETSWDSAAFVSTKGGLEGDGGW